MEIKKCFCIYQENVKITRSFGTFHFTESHLRRILGDLRELRIKNVHDLNRSAVVSLFEIWDKRGVSPHTKQKRISLIKRALNYSGIYRKGVSDFPRILYKKKSFRIVPRDVLTSLMGYFGPMGESMDPHDLTRYLVFMLLFYTGARANELCHIKVRNINFYYNSIDLDFTKTGKPRVVFFDETLLDPLKRYIAMEERKYLFRDFRFGKDFDSDHISSILRFACKKMKVERISPHMMRHTFATMMVENGCPLISLQYMMGHDDPETTEIYLHMSTGYYRKEFERYMPKM
jgi:integrase